MHPERTINTKNTSAAEENTVAAPRVELEYCANNQLSDAILTLKVTQNRRNERLPPLPGLQKTLYDLAEKRYGSAQVFTRPEKMRLYTFALDQRRRLGVEWQGAMVDLTAAYAAVTSLEEPNPKRLRALPGDALAFLRLGLPAHDAALAVFNFVQRRRAAPVGEQLLYPMSAIKILAPLARSEKIICIGNSESNCRIFYPKLPNTVIGPGDVILKPQTATQLHAELKLGIIVGKTLRNASETDVVASIFGYTLINDISVEKDLPAENTFTLGKNFDTFCPMGPCIVTADEIADSSELHFRTSVNGGVFHSSVISVSRNLFAPLVSSLSRIMTLEPGDVICSPPAINPSKGVVPPVILKPGDIVRLEVDLIGALENPVVEGETAFLAASRQIKTGA